MIKTIRNLFSSSLFILNRPSSAFCTKKTQTNKAQDLISKFTDQLDEGKQRPITSGRTWKASQLRIKSTEDLHKLWFVCVRQKNLVLADELLKQHDQTYTRKAGKIIRVEKLQQTMRRIIFVINEREQIKKQYRKQLEEEYIAKKTEQLQTALSRQPEPLPPITHQLLRAKYQALRRGIDNVDYLEKIWKTKEEMQSRLQRADERASKVDPSKEFTSFWEYQTTIGQRPTQEEILKSHIKNWKSLNLKQRKIVLGFLNARRSKDAKSAFVKELKILGQKIAYEQAKNRTEQPNN